MPLTSFCGLWTLKVGAAILAAVFFALAGAILAANVFDYHYEYSWFPFSLILMIFFVIGLIIAGAFMFASSYNESRSLALMTVVVIVILICYWLILCAFSFLSNPDHVRGVCIDTRCPETFWLGNLGYRRQHLKEEGTTVTVWSVYLKTTTRAPFVIITIPPIEPFNVRFKKSKQINREPIKPFESQGETKREQQTKEEFEAEIKNGQGDVEFKEKLGYVNNKKRSNGRGDLLQGDYPWSEPPPRAPTLEPESTTKKPRWKEDEEELYTEEPSRYIFGSAMIGAIILFIINLLFLLFSAFVMYSWAQELSLEDYYYYYYYDDDDSMEI